MVKWTKFSLQGCRSRFLCGFCGTFSFSSAIVEAALRDWIIVMICGRLDNDRGM